LCSDNSCAAVPSAAALLDLSSLDRSSTADGGQCNHLCELEADNKA
jgi:hypothetical protein